MSEVDIQGTIDIDGSVSKFSISNTKDFIILSLFHPV